MWDVRVHYSRFQLNANAQSLHLCGTFRLEEELFAEVTIIEALQERAVSFEASVTARYIV
jgi:hypothetical protein